METFIILRKDLDSFFDPFDKEMTKLYGPYSSDEEANDKIMEVAAEIRNRYEEDPDILNQNKETKAVEVIGFGNDFYYFIKRKAEL